MTHSELPYSIPEGSYCIFVCGRKKKRHAGPSKAAFPSRMISHGDTSGLGYFIYRISPSCWGEACPHCPFLEYRYTPILPWTRTQVEFPLGKKHATCIFGIFMLPRARVFAKFSQADTQLQRVPLLAGSPRS